MGKTINEKRSAGLTVTSVVVLSACCTLIVLATILYNLGG